MEGSGISQGQRQRILIARAVYKNPEFIFFDELFLFKVWSNLLTNKHYLRLYFHRHF